MIKALCFFVLTSFVASDLAYAQDYLNTNNISTQKAKQRLQALKWLDAWIEYDMADPQKRKSSAKGIVKLISSTFRQEREQGEYLAKVKGEILAAERKGQRITLQSYIEWHEDMVAAKELHVGIGFQFLGRELNSQLRDADTFIHSMQSLDTEQRKSAISRFPMPKRDWLTDADKIEFQDRGLSGEPARYAAKVELEAKLEHLNELKNMKDSANNPSDEAKIDDEIEIAKNEIEQFQQELKDFDHRPSTLLSLMMGPEYRLPVPEGEYTYYPYPTTQAEVDVVSKQERLAKANQERNNAIVEVENQRAQILDFYLPGYRELEGRQAELSTTISKLSSEIQRRKQYRINNYRDKIYPLRNKEINLWHIIDGIQNLQDGVPLNDNQQRELARTEAAFFVNKTTPDRSDALIRIKATYIRKLLSEVRGNTGMAETDRSPYLEEFKNITDQMNRMRLGIDTKGAQKRLQELNALLLAETNSTEKLKIQQNIDEYNRFLSHVDSRKRLARSYYEKSPVMKRWHSNQEPPKDRIIVKAHKKLQSVCRGIISKAATFLTF